MGALAGMMGYGNAATSASNSLAWGAAGTGIQATGDLVSGLGGLEQASYMARVSQTNAAIDRANAAAAVQAGLYSESASKLRTGLLIGEQRAAQGANNVDVNVGSPAAVRQTTATIGAMDAAMIHYNAAREAYGLRTEAASASAQSKLYSMAGLNALEAAGFKSASTLIAGASSLSSKASQYGLAFGPGGPGSAPVPTTNPLGA